jgi:hypothetical protein
MVANRHSPDSKREQFSSFCLHADSAAIARAERATNAEQKTREMHRARMGDPEVDVYVAN